MVRFLRRKLMEATISVEHKHHRTLFHSLFSPFLVSLSSNKYNK